MRARLERDTVEFTSGLVLGATLGLVIGALLAPDRSLRARFRRRLRRPRRRLGKRAGDAGTATGVAVGRSIRLAREARSFGTELLVAAREELIEEARRRKGNHRGRAGAEATRFRSLRERLPTRGNL